MKISFIAIGLLSAGFSIAAPKWHHEPIDAIVDKPITSVANGQPSAIPTLEPRDKPLEVDPIDAAAPVDPSSILLEGDPFNVPGPVIPANFPDQVDAFSVPASPSSTSFITATRLSASPILSPRNDIQGQPIEFDPDDVADSTETDAQTASIIGWFAQPGTLSPTSFVTESRPSASPILSPRDNVDEQPLEGDALQLPDGSLIPASLLFSSPPLMDTVTIPGYPVPTSMPSQADFISAEETPMPVLSPCEFITGQPHEVDPAGAPERNSPSILKDPLGPPELVIPSSAPLLTVTVPGAPIPTSMPPAATKHYPIPVYAILPRTTPDLTEEQKLNHFAQFMWQNLAGPASQFHCNIPKFHGEDTCRERFDSNLTHVAGLRDITFYATGMMLADFSLADKIMHRVRNEQKRQTENELAQLYAKVLDMLKEDMRHLRTSVNEFKHKTPHPEDDINRRSSDVRLEKRGKGAVGAQLTEGLIQGGTLALVQMANKESLKEEQEHEAKKKEKKKQKQAEKAAQHAYEESLITMATEDQMQPCTEGHCDSGGGKGKDAQKMEKMAEEQCREMEEDEEMISMYGPPGCALTWGDLTSGSGSGS